MSMAARARKGMLSLTEGLRQLAEVWMAEAPVRAGLVGHDPDDGVTVDGSVDVRVLSARVVAIFPDHLRVKLLRIDDEKQEILTTGE